MGIKRTVSIRRIDLWGKKPLELKKWSKNCKKLKCQFCFVILKCKIAKEDAIFEKSLFCEKFLEYDFTWKKCWFQIKIQNFILMTRPSIQSICHTWFMPHSPYYWPSPLPPTFCKLIGEPCYWSKSGRESLKIVK